MGETLTHIPQEIIETIAMIGEPTIELVTDEIIEGADCHSCMPCKPHGGSGNCYPDSGPGTGK